MNATCIIKWLIVVLASFACASIGVAQRTWKVNSGGAYGAHFLDIPAAVAAASPGDTILVYNTPTAAAFYTAPTIDKSLCIAGALILLSPPVLIIPGSVPIRGVLRVQNIPAGQKVVLSNLTHTHQAPGFGVVAELVLMDNQGSVLIDDYLYDGGSGYPGQRVSIERCDHVVIRGTEFWIGGAPIRIVDSNVLFTTTDVQVWAPSPFLPYTVQTPSVFLQRSTLTLSGSVVEGSGPLGWQFPTPNTAVAIDGGSVRVGASSVLRGGYFPGLPGGLPSSFFPAFTYTTSAPASVERDPRAYPFSHPYQQPPSIVPLDETFHDWVVAGQDFHVQVYGPPGGFAVLMLGDMQAPTTTPYGMLGIDPMSAAAIDLVPLPTATQGGHEWTYYCPTSASNGYAYALQCMTLSPSGVLSLTLPSPLTVGWEHTRIP